jgi:hypothetical protein
MRFSTGTFCSEQARCFIDLSLGLYPRDCPRTVWLGAPDCAFVALSNVCYCSRPPKRTSDCRTTPSMRSSTPLATSPMEFGDPGFPPPAPSVLALSQHFDGLLLQSVCLSCFIQAPPMGFKEHGRIHRDHVPSCLRAPLRGVMSAVNVSTTHPQRRNARRCFQPEYPAPKPLRQSC